MPPPTSFRKSTDSFKALFTRPEAHDVQVVPEFNQPLQGSFSLKLSASAKVSTMFAKLLGQSEIQLSASSEVLWGIKKLNLALVLDNTGSMSSSAKMTNLKLAAHNLLTTLKNSAKTPGDIKNVTDGIATKHVDTGAESGGGCSHDCRQDRFGIWRGA